MQKPTSRTKSWWDDLPGLLKRLEAFAAKPGVDEQHKRDLEDIVHIVVRRLVPSIVDLVSDEMKRMRPAKDARHPGSVEKDLAIARMYVEQNKKLFDIGQESGWTQCGRG
jgi:hypothetical protein